MSVKRKFIMQRLKWYEEKQKKTVEQILSEMEEKNKRLRGEKDEQKG